MNIIEQLEAEQVAALAAKREVPDFAPGDTVQVNVWVREGNRERTQAYEGVVIARDGGGLNESFTVRKISYGEGVERVFPVHSPLIDSIEVVRRGKVRRAKLYYLRGRRGKSARIAERKDARAAKIAFNKALKVQPAFAPAHWGLIHVSLERKDYRALPKQLLALEQTCGVSLDGLDQRPEFAEFVKSRYYASWQKRRQ